VPPVRATDSAATALQAIGRASLAHAENNLPGLHAGDAEAVHQIRVACRKLRTALASLGPGLPASRRDAEYDAVGAILKAFMEALDATRNWDVIAREVVAPVREAQPGDPSLARLATRVEAEQAKAREALRDHVESPGHRREMARVAAFLDTLSDSDGGATVAEIGPPLLDRRRRAARRRGRKFRRQNAADRHRFRIAVKKLRYTLDLLAPLCDAADAARYLDRLKKLQDRLGHANDVAVARAMLASLAETASPDEAISLRHATRRVIDRHDRDLAGSEKKLRRQIRRFRRTKPPWRDG
jgi:CHAD domain-containing protein